MHYPFDPQKSSSDSSRSNLSQNQDQFMMHESSISMQSNNLPAEVPQDMQKIFSYMKNVMSNPLLMDQMEKFLSAKQAQKNNSFINSYNDSLSISRMENQMKQPPDSYLIEPTISRRPQSLKMIPIQNAKKILSPQLNPAMKKGLNVGSSYIEKQTLQSENYSQQFEQKVQQKSKINQEKSMKPVVKPPVSFEDMPIKSNYIASQQFNNFDSGSEMLASYPQNPSQFYNNPSTTKSKKSTAPKAAQVTNISNKYIQLEERPINGTNKDFKQLLRQKGVESPFDQNLIESPFEQKRVQSSFDQRPLPTLAKNSSQNWVNQQYNENQFQQPESYNQQKPKRQFLKRGTRQYLSSAKDKKQPTKQNKNKDKDELNNSRLQNDKQKDKTPAKRDVSQNRILSKRNTTNNDKSLAKLRPQQNLNDSQQQSFYQQNKQTTKRSITPKNQRGLQSKSPILPPKSTKPSNNPTKNNKLVSGNQGSGKKKNVFDDSSSSDQDQQQNFQDKQEYQSTRRNNFMEHQSLKSQNSSKAIINSYQPDQEFNMFSRQKKQQVIQGVFLTKSQLQTILEKYTPKNNSSTKSLKSSQEKFNELRKKYTDLCNLVEKQKIEHQQKMQKEREQFQVYKQQEMQKIKNQRRVMQRQVKSSMPSQTQNLQKDKQEVENLKKQLQKQKEDHKKKEKNNKILIEKYKKQNEELKFRIQKLEEENSNKLSGNFSQNNFSSAASERQTNPNTSNSRSTLMNDKSKSKLNTKDVSPGKGKTNKKLKNAQEEEQEMMNDKNYKKTVPLYKAKQQKSQKRSYAVNQKKNQNSNNYDDNENSDDENLPTFKVQKKTNEQLKTKTQKKYQYVQNSVQNHRSSKTQNQLKHERKSSNHQSKASSKNVFVDDSDEQNVENQISQNQQFDDEEGRQSGFFKKQKKYEKLSDLINDSFSIKDVNPQLIEKLFKYQNNIEYRNYLSRINNPKRIIVNSNKNGVDKKITNIYSDKSKQILFQNGVKKEIFQDGYTIIYFKNGDIKQKLSDGTILYYFIEKQVDQITLINGLNIYRFENNQVELHFNGGKYIEISHPDGTIKILGSPVH